MVESRAFTNTYAFAAIHKDTYGRLLHIILSPFLCFSLGKNVLVVGPMLVAMAFCFHTSVSAGRNALHRSKSWDFTNDWSTERGLFSPPLLFNLFSTSRSLADRVPDCPTPLSMDPSVLVYGAVSSAHGRI